MPLPKLFEGEASGALAPKWTGKTQQESAEQTVPDQAPPGGYRLFSDNVDDFREELKVRDERYVGFFEEQQKRYPEEDMLRKELAQSLWLEELGYEREQIADRRAHEHYAQKMKVDLSEDGALYTKMREQATRYREEESAVEDYSRAGFESFYNPEGPKRELWKSVIEGGEGTALQKRAFMAGAEAAAEHGAGGVRQAANQAVQLMQLYVEKPLTSSIEQRKQLNEMLDWYANAPQEAINRWRQAISLSVRGNPALMDAFEKGVAQRVLRTLGTATDAVAGFWWGVGASATGPDGYDARMAKLTKLKRDLYSALDEDVAPLYHAKEGSMRAGLEGFQRSIPFFVAAMTGPGGMLALGAPQEAMATHDELARQYPDASPAALDAIAMGTGAVNAGIEHLQLRMAGAFVGKVFPKLAKVDPLKMKLPGGKLALGAGVMGAEFAQETIQDMTAPAVTQLAEWAGAEFPEFSFKEEMQEVWEHSPERFWAVVPFVFLGGGLRALQMRSVRETLGDPVAMLESGVSEEVQEAVIELAQTDPAAALERFQEEYQALSPEDRQANRDQSMRKAARQQAEEQDKPVILSVGDRAEVYLPGEPMVEAASMDEAKEAMATWQVVDAAREVESLREILDAFAKVREGTAEAETLAQETAAKRREAGLQERVQTTEQDIAPDTETPALKAAKDVAGISGRAQVVARNWVERGAEGQAEVVIELTKGNVNPFYVVREGAQGYLKTEAAAGRVEMEWIADQLEAVQERSGQRLFRDRDNELEIIEAFSDVVVAYSAGDLQTEALPSGFRAWLNDFIKTIARMLRLSKSVQEMREAGELDADFESFVQRSLGMNPEQQAEMVERQAREELTEMARQEVEGLAALDAFEEEQRMEWRREVESEEQMLDDPDQEAEMRKATAVEAMAGFSLRENTLFDEINELGGLMSKTQARKSKKLDKSEGEYDGLPDDLTFYEKTKLFKRDGQLPSTLAQGLYERNVIEEPTPGAFWESFGNAIKQSRSARRPGTMWGETYSVTPARDAEYLAAVERGDLDAAQQMVDEAAKAAGYDTTLHYHAHDGVHPIGSPRQNAWGGGINSEGIWLTRNQEYAVDHASNYPKGTVDNVYVKHDREKAFEAKYAGEDGITVESLKQEGFDSARESQMGFLVVFEPSQIKSADPVTYDDAGQVIPLSERFDAGRDEITYSVAPQNPLLDALQTRIAQGDETLLPFFEKMQERVRAISEQFQDRDDGSGDLDLRTALAFLGAMQRVMPRELKGMVGSARRLADFKTLDQMANELARRLPRIGRALEAYLQKEYRKAIRKTIEKGSPKVSEARTKGGKIGGAGHAIFFEAQAAMPLTPEEGELRAQGYMAQLEGAQQLTMEQLDEIEGKMEAVTLFADYENAPSARLKAGLALLQDVYSEGRKEWLAELGRRRDLRQGRVELLLEGVGAQDSEKARAASKRRDEEFLRRISEGMMSGGLSGSELVRRLGEATGNPVVKEVVQEMEDAFADAENLQADLDYADNVAFSEALERITGAKTEYGRTKALRDWSTAPGEDVPVTRLEGRRAVTIKVPMRYADAIARGEASGFTKKNGEKVELNAAQVAELRQQMEYFEEMPEDEQRKVRSITVETLEAAGSRNTLGDRTQLELLNLYLNLNQPDQFEKLEKMGYDETTVRELENYLRPQVMEMGRWMVDYLRGDQATLDKLHRAEKGVPLGLVENYFPVRNDVGAADLGDLSLEGAGIMQTGRSIGFVKGRVTNQARPAVVDALAVFLAHRSQVNFWKSHVTAMREWGGVVRDERFSFGIKTAMGDTYYNALEQRMKRIEAGGWLKVGKSSALDRWIRQLKRRYSMAVLGGRLSTLMVNLSAFNNIGMEMPVKEMARGMQKLARRPEAFKEALNSPAIKRRLRDGATVEAQMAKASGPDKKPVVRQLETWGEKVLAPINYVDTGANAVGAAVLWEYTRSKVLEAGGTAAEAKAEAERAVDRFFRRAAQPTSRFSRSEWELSGLENSLSALFAMFVSEPRKNLAIAYLAARQLATGKGIYKDKAMAAQAVTVSLGVMIAAEYAIRTLYRAMTKAEDDDEEGIFNRWWAQLSDGKAWSYALTVNHINGIPVFGGGWEFLMAELVNAAPIPGEDVRAFNKTENLLVQSAEKAARGTSGIIKGLTDQDEDVEAQDAFAIMQGLGGATPGGPLFSQLANVGDTTVGFFHSNLSAEKKVERLKGRFNAFKRSLTETYGPTTVNGKLDREVQATKWKALEDWVRNHLAPYPQDQQDAFYQMIELPNDVRKALGAPKKDNNLPED